MLTLTNTSIGGAGGRPHVDVLFRMGYRTLIGTLLSTTEGQYHNTLLMQPWAARFRTRGAAAGGAGTAFRNRHWTTAYANSKHIPIPFKANPLETIRRAGVVVLQALKRSTIW